MIKQVVLLILFLVIGIKGYSYTLIGNWKLDSGQMVYVKVYELKNKKDESLIRCNYVQNEQWLWDVRKTNFLDTYEEYSLSDFFKWEKVKSWSCYRGVGSTKDGKLYNVLILLNSYGTRFEWFYVRQYGSGFDSYNSKDLWEVKHLFSYIKIKKK